MATRSEQSTGRTVPPRSAPVRRSGAQAAGSSPLVALPDAPAKHSVPLSQPAPQPVSTRPDLLAGPIDEGHLLIPAGWMMIAPVLLAALVLTGLSSWSLPRLSSALMALVAITLTAAAPLFSRFEQSHGRQIAIRFATLGIGVGLPMLLFGVAIARWTDHAETVGWPSSIGVLVLIGLAALAILNGRLMTGVVAKVCLWLGVAIIVGNGGHFLVLSVGGLAGMLFARRHLRLESEQAFERRRVERAQRRAEELLSEYERSGLGWFWETDRRGAITYVSPTIGKQLGRKSKQMIARPLTELFILDAPGQEGERTLNFHLSARSSFQELAVRAATGEEDERWWSISGRPVYDSFNNFLGFRGSGSDLTEKKRSQEHASRLARYDSLTGLANRVQMSETLEKILSARREEHRACAVLLLDLDRFKQVNDTLGHPAGDQLLKQVAQRLEHTVREAGRVGRLGGDEFKVIIPGRVGRDDLAYLAHRIIQNLSQPYSIDGHRVVIGASVGIALSPDDGSTSEALIRNADLALYAAKDGGRGRHHFYAADLHSDAEERRQLEQDLRDAISSGGLQLYYQPVVHTMTEKITGFEALLRWNHPVHGPMSPAKFVPVAEDAGLIAPIGEWALRTACHDLASWPDSVRIAVNVSPLQFANPALPAIVTSALAEAGIAPDRLELEITESVFLNDDSATEAMFIALKRVGVRLALDDFGTGYSSLGYLKKAPFDKIKIDQSFVRGATIAGSRNGAIIASIVSLAEALNMETTAEGVETLDELDLVRTLGCSHIQGFIYEKALSKPAATALLQAGLTAVATGPKSARASRQTMLRKVRLDHGSESYEGTIRNISTSGALIEGLWNVPPGTAFVVQLSATASIGAIARWSKDDRMGIEFDRPLEIDATGRIGVVGERASRLERVSEPARKAG